MKQAVLLLAHGAPERLEDVEEYLRLVRGGRLTSPHILKEVRDRYARIGGGSPLLQRTREQAEALEAALGVRVYFAMRNWHPLIADVMRQIGADGVERLVAVCLAPQYSKRSVGMYFRRTQEAKAALGMSVEIVWTKSFHDHPLLVEAFAEKLVPLLPADRVLFTAHSLPGKILDEADAYPRETRATARAVADRAGLSEWEFAYQSQGMTDEAWLGPTVESRLDEYAAQGVRRVLLAPIGFVSDHVEILYDVDVLFREYAQGRGMDLARPESLNDSPRLIAALADVAGERLRNL